MDDFLDKAIEKVKNFLIKPRKIIPKIDIGYHFREKAVARLKSELTYDVIEKIFSNKGISFYQEIINKARKSAEEKNLGCEDYKSLAELYLAGVEENNNDLFGKYIKEVGVSEKRKRSNSKMKGFCRAIIEFAIETKDKRILAELERINKIYNIYSVGTLGKFPYIEINESINN